ncbi:hypothetical protein [Flavobacterium sp. 3HN19-14]|uniref:hypothetical protein n=1 Tax=Flavobacterium sp. 3HN19-14 TaxID=3448133 RepID=UPI003EE1E5EB
MFAVTISNAQSNDIEYMSPVKDLSQDEYLKAIDGYLKMSFTPSYKEYRSKTFSFLGKLPKNLNSEALFTDDAFEKWITEKLKFSKFKSVEEAVKLRKLCIDLKFKLIRDNFDIYKLLGRATPKQVIEIIKPDLRPDEPRI